MYSRITLISLVPFRFARFINIPYLCGMAYYTCGSCLGIIISCGMRYSEDTTLVYQLLVGTAPTSVRA